MRRPNKNRPLVVGLTGSIGMGKSTAAKMLSHMGLPVHNADKTVHDAMKRGGGAVKAMSRLFPQALKGGAIDRSIVGEQVFRKPQMLRKAEGILHPFVHRAEKKFFAEAKKKKKQAVVLDIPLLFETGAEKRCDVVICVTAPRAVQAQRVMKRPGMTKAKFQAILKQQMPDKEKCRRADCVINTGKGPADTRRRLVQFMKEHVTGKKI